MKSSLTDVLCTRCGLCCDGSLFSDAELAGVNEAPMLEVMGLQIEDDDGGRGALLLQPCNALKGKRCSIYPHRPGCCRTFECRLLKEVRRGDINVEQAKTKIEETSKQIERVKVLTVQLGQRDKHLPLKERYVEAMGMENEAVTTPEIIQKRAELEVAMASVENLIQETFLGAVVESDKRA